MGGSQSCTDRVDVLATLMPYAAAPFVCRALLRFALRGRSRQLDLVSHTLF
jgi:hypothetical protein